MTAAGTQLHPLAEIAIARLDEERRRRGLSLAQLAVKVGRSPSGMSFIFNGERQLSLGLLARLCDVLGIPPWMALRPDTECENCGGRPAPGWICGVCRKSSPPQCKSQDGPAPGEGRLTAA
jgi:transcriptional regulator with XRE-family HTH domain